MLAVTTAWHIGNERVEGDTIFNTAIDWDSYRGPIDFGALDLRRVAIHEFGHFTGLGHSEQFDAIMYAAYDAPRRSSSCRSIGA